MKAETQEEFAREWIKHARSLYGFYPLAEDYEEMVGIQAKLAEMIVRKARTLDLPEEDIDHVLCPECSKLLEKDSESYYCRECEYEELLE